MPWRWCCCCRASWCQQCRLCMRRCCRRQTRSPERRAHTRACREWSAHPGLPHNAAPPAVGGAAGTPPARRSWSPGAPATPAAAAPCGWKSMPWLRGKGWCALAPASRTSSSLASRNPINCELRRSERQGGLCCSNTAGRFRTSRAARNAFLRTSRAARNSSSRFVCHNLCEERFQMNCGALITGRTLHGQQD